MKKVRVLSIDGGGIRGIIPATVLNYVEEQLQKKSENPNARIADYFDLVAGTSTGGILTCFYLFPNPKPIGKKPPSTKYKAKKALEFYSEKGYEIFNASKRKGWCNLRQLFNATNYSPKNIEKIFQEEFGELKISELLKPCMVTTYDLKNQRSFFFTSVEPEHKMREFYVKDVARSTSAAPTYFPPAKIKNIKTHEPMVNVDGGVFANNPTMCAYAECRNSEFKTHNVSFPKAKEMLILSLGTGGGQIKFPDVSRSGKWGVINWAKSVPELMMDGSIDAVHYQIAHLFGTLEDNHHLNYKRVDVPADKRHYSKDMADASPENIEALKVAGNLALESSLEGNDKELGLDGFIDQLIENQP